MYISPTLIIIIGACVVAVCTVYRIKEQSTAFTPATRGIGHFESPEDAARMAAERQAGEAQLAKAHVEVAEALAKYGLVSICKDDFQKHGISVLDAEENEAAKRRLAVMREDFQRSIATQI